MYSNKIMRTLFQLAIQTPPVKRARIAAAIVHKKHILAVGINSLASSQLARKFAKNKFCVYNHAEVAAIKNFINQYSIEDLRHCSLYVCRAKIIEDKWTTGLAKPCDGCAGAIDFFQIKNTFFSLDESYDIGVLA